MEKILSEVRNCTICKSFLPNVPRPIIQASSSSKILIIGQAPGQKVQNSGVPWDDASGNNLREWLGVDKQTFYNDRIFALIPMGFCFPGTGKSGDLPPTARVRAVMASTSLKINDRCKTHHIDRAICPEILFEKQCQIYINRNSSKLQ